MQSFLLAFTDSHTISLRRSPRGRCSLAKLQIVTRVGLPCSCIKWPAAGDELNIRRGVNEQVQIARRGRFAFRFLFALRRRPRVDLPLRKEGMLPRISGAAMLQNGHVALLHRAVVPLAASATEEEPLPTADHHAPIGHCDTFRGYEITIISTDSGISFQIMSEL